MNAPALLFRRASYDAKRTKRLNECDDMPSDDFKCGLRHSDYSLCHSLPYESSILYERSGPLYLSLTELTFPPEVRSIWL